MKVKSFANLWSRLRVGNRSLKTTLALYFIPISVIPTFSISYYAYRLFEENTRDGLAARSRSERDAVLTEIDTRENELVSFARAEAKLPRLMEGLGKRDPEGIKQALTGAKSEYTFRFYGPNAEFVFARKHNYDSKIDYLSRESLMRVRNQGETTERYFAGDGALTTVVRVLVRDRGRLYGVMEAERRIDNKVLADIRNRRQIDLMILSREMKIRDSSFALSGKDVQSATFHALQNSVVSPNPLPVFAVLGETRFGMFLYDLPFEHAKNKKWGYVAVLLSMNAVDATLGKLKLAIIYLSVLLMLTATLAIFVFSNRLVKPIVSLVSAMKRVKTGRAEQIAPVDSTYEIEYLVHSFNDMSRNVTAAKRALEVKLEELRDTNQELGNTQATLVQSAKMISLGQIVAGVAHELNNPIGFIYSNMHHLVDYLKKIRLVIENYRAGISKLPEAEQTKLRSLEAEMELDFILKDMEDLTRSCVDGANRTKEIVLGLRTFSRVEESTFRLADIHEGIRSTIRLLGSEFKDRIRLHEEFSELPPVECNLSQMNQVFMNLLSNAVQAIEVSGDIWVRTRLRDELVFIEIEDNGPGMSKGTLEKIFDPFFTTKKVGQGTGLGLSIAYGLIQRHNGEISVSSEIGHGTKFTIRIPLRQTMPLAG